MARQETQAENIKRMLTPARGISKEFLQTINSYTEERAKTGTKKWVLLDKVLKIIEKK